MRSSLRLLPQMLILSLLILGSVWNLCAHNSTISASKLLEQEAKTLFVQSKSQVADLKYGPKFYFERLTTFQHSVLEAMELLVTPNKEHTDLTQVSKDLEHQSKEALKFARDMKDKDDMSVDRLFVYQNMIKGCYHLYLKGRQLVQN